MCSDGERPSFDLIWAVSLSTALLCSEPGRTKKRRRLCPLVWCNELCMQPLGPQLGTGNAELAALAPARHGEHARRRCVPWSPGLRRGILEDGSRAGDKTTMAAAAWTPARQLCSRLRDIVLEFHLLRFSSEVLHGRCSIKCPAQTVTCEWSKCLVIP